MRMTRADVIAIARAWIGTPYHHQASRKGVGTDCLGLVRGIYRSIHGAEPEAMPAYSPDWAEVSGVETLLSAAQRCLTSRVSGEWGAGDVLVFRIRKNATAKHVGIATSSSTMVHAVETIGTREVAITAWWRRRIVGVFSFPGIED